MQNSIWKLTALAGVIGIGCLAVLVVQQGLHDDQVQLSIPGKSAKNPPDPNTSQTPESPPVQAEPSFSGPSQPETLGPKPNGSTSPWPNNVAQNVVQTSGIDFNQQPSVTGKTTAATPGLLNVPAAKPLRLDTPQTPTAPVTLVGGEKPTDLSGNPFAVELPTTAEKPVTTDSNPFATTKSAAAASTDAKVEPNVSAIPLNLDDPVTPIGPVGSAKVASEPDFNPFGSVELPQARPETAEPKKLPADASKKAAISEEPSPFGEPSRTPSTLLPALDPAIGPKTQPASESPKAEPKKDENLALPLPTLPESGVSPKSASPDSSNPFNLGAPEPESNLGDSKVAPVKDLQPINLDPSAESTKPAAPATPEFPGLPDAFPPLGTGPTGQRPEPRDASDDAAPGAVPPTSTSTPSVTLPTTGDRPLGGFELEPVNRTASETNAPAIAFPVEKTAPASEAKSPASETPSPAAQESLKGHATIDRKGILHSLKPQLRIEKRAPKSATLGKPLVYDIIVTNTGTTPAEKVVVEDGIPKGSNLDATKPQAELIEGRLVWKIGTIAPGKQRIISVRIIPVTEGSIGSIATVYSVAEVAAVTKITAPKLELTITAPAKAEMGETVVFQFKIKNTGTSAAENVFIRNKLPAGLTHPSGDDLEYKIDLLAVGASKTVKLTLTTTQPGEIVNVADATADGDIKVAAQAKVTVTGSRLVVQRTGPQRRFVGYPAEFKNEVSNRSKETVVNAMLVEKLPAGMEFVEASTGGQYNAVQRTVAWKIDRLAPAQSKSYTVKLVPRAVGTKTSVVQVTESTGGEAAAKADTQIEDFASLALDISEVLRPVAIGNRVALRIRARNRGTTQATNVEVVVNVPPAMRVVTAGPGKYEVIGNQVRFTAKESLAGNANADYDLVLEAVTNADVRLKAQVSADQMKTPLSREEAIVIFKP